MRNRKILSTLNPKKVNKDPEYKNYYSTDSDLYEEEDYLKIDLEAVRAELNFLRKRRLERRYARKLEILERRRLANAGRPLGGQRIVRPSATPTKARLPERPQHKTVEHMTSHKLKARMKLCVVPKITEQFGASSAKVDSNLDNEWMNPLTSQKRAIERRKELEHRMENPLTYPSANETIESQNIVVPDETEMAKLAEEGKFFFGDSQMENLIA